MLLLDYYYTYCKQRGRRSNGDFIPNVVIPAQLRGARELNLKRGSFIACRL